MNRSVAGIFPTKVVDTGNGWRTIVARSHRKFQPIFGWRFAARVLQSDVANSGAFIQLRSRPEGFSMRHSILDLFVVFSFAFPCTQSAYCTTQRRKGSPAGRRFGCPARRRHPAGRRRQKGRARADPSGSWKWDFETPDGNKMEFVLKLNWDGKKLDGKYTAFDNTTKVENGKVDKDSVSFVVRPEFGGNSFDVKFTARLPRTNSTVRSISILAAARKKSPGRPSGLSTRTTSSVSGTLTSTRPRMVNPIRRLSRSRKMPKACTANTSNDFFDLDASKVEDQGQPARLRIVTATAR